MNPDMSDLQREFGAMKEQLRALETKLKDAETWNKEGPTVAFSAALDSGGAYITCNAEKTIIYNKVITNIGNAFHESTGIFTAPVAGVYYFTFFYHAGGERRANLNLYKNNQHIVTSSDHKSSSDGADNGGNAVILELNQEDQVSVRMAENSHIWGNKYHHTTFSGLLLREVWKN